MNENLNLHHEELELFQDFERGELKSIGNMQETKRRMEESARAMLKKDQRINIRISSRDLARLKKRAVKEGLPYQTLTSSTLHKFVMGKLKHVD